MKDYDIACLGCMFLGTAIGGMAAKWVTPSWWEITICGALYFVCMFFAWKKACERTAQLRKEFVAKYGDFGASDSDPK